MLSRSAIPDELGRLIRIFDRRLVRTQPQQVNVGHKDRPCRSISPAVMARSNLHDRSPDRHQRLDLRGKVQAAVPARPVERFHAERISGQVDTPRGSVGDSEGELAAQMADRVLPPLQKGLEHHLGVAGGAQPVAAARELGTQLAVVEDLAVVTQDPPAVRGDPRLPGSRPVDDPQPLRAREQVVVVGNLFDLAARCQGLDHPEEGQSVGPPTKDESDAAHRGSQPSVYFPICRSRPASRGPREG